jgi:hypothetical protein
MWTWIALSLGKSDHIVIVTLFLSECHDHFNCYFYVTINTSSWSQSDHIKSGVLKLFCTATLSKYLQNFCEPKMSQTTTNLR